MKKLYQSWAIWDGVEKMAPPFFFEKANVPRVGVKDLPVGSDLKLVLYRGIILFSLQKD